MTFILRYFAILQRLVPHVHNIIDKTQSGVTLHELDDTADLPNNITKKLMEY